MTIRQRQLETQQLVQAKFSQVKPQSRKKTAIKSNIISERPMGKSALRSCLCLYAVSNNQPSYYFLFHYFRNINLTWNNSQLIKCICNILLLCNDFFIDLFNTINPSFRSHC